MGLFSKKPSVAEVAALREQLEEMQNRLARSERVLVAAAQEDLPGKLARLTERVASHDSSAEDTVRRLAATEERLTAVSNELANQLRELSSDIDALADAPGTGGQAGTADEVVEALRAGQAKLANEQARYEIALREDLAILAEQVRKLGGR